MSVRKAFIVMASATSLLMALTPAGSAEQQAYTRTPASHGVPEVKKDCSICHLPGGAGTPGALKIPLSQLCLYCHRDRISPAEHKVDFVPTMNVRTLPLTDGKMTCATCHDSHANPHGKLLRMPARELCQACHPK